eukprot:g5928.t1
MTWHQSLPSTWQETADLKSTKSKDEASENLQWFQSPNLDWKNLPVDSEEIDPFETPANGITAADLLNINAGGNANDVTASQLRSFGCQPESKAAKKERKMREKVEMEKEKKRSEKQAKKDRKLAEKREKKLRKEKSRLCEDKFDRLFKGKPSPSVKPLKHKHISASDLRSLNVLPEPKKSMEKGEEEINLVEPKSGVDILTDRFDDLFPTQQQNLVKPPPIPQKKRAAPPVPSRSKKPTKKNLL